MSSCASLERSVAHISTLHFDLYSRAAIEKHDLIKSGVNQDGMDVLWDESHVAKVVRKHLLKEGNFEMASQFVFSLRY